MTANFETHLTEEKVGRVAYSYVPEDWAQEEFLRVGGFVVVFLNYNKRPYIEASVESALNQDFPRLEMFFMDDASTDGSGDVMEDLVRKYHGRHKVTVVRNEVNVYITGQWNVVSKLATGSWLGMFCGDDVAHPDRVSLVAERIRKYPTLRGISTAAVDMDICTGKALPDSHYVPRPYFAKGTDTWESLDANFKCNGSTSFWHKSLFVNPIPRVPLDDNYIHFKIFVLNRGVNAPIYLYDSSIKTIDYSLGVGVCGSGIFCKSDDSPRMKWITEISRYKSLVSKWAATMRRALDDARCMGVAPDDLMPFTCSLWGARIRSAGTGVRLALAFPLIAFVIRSGVPFGRKLSLVKRYCYFLAVEFFGLRVASIIREIGHGK